jgi:hypothetical protein
MGCVDCGGDNNWDNCDALEIKKGNKPAALRKLIIQSQAEGCSDREQRPSRLTLLQCKCSNNPQFPNICLSQALRHCYKKDRRLDYLHTEAAGQFLITRLPTRPTLTCSEVDG